MIGIATLLLLCAIGVAAICEINLMEPRPIVVKRFGSQTAIIRKQLSRIQLVSNDSVSLHCPSGFTLYSDQPLPKDESTIEFSCNGNAIYINPNGVALTAGHNLHIQCNNDYMHSLYESNISLAGCDNGAMTLLLGFRLPGKKGERLVGLCYDLGSSRLRFVSYLAYAPTNGLVERNWANELQGLQLDSPLDRFTDYFNFAGASALGSAMGQQRLGALFKPQLFEYASLLQDEVYAKQLGTYQAMFKVIWQRALREGNWQHFLRALRTATNDHSGLKYNMRVGVSGVAALPPASNCSGSQALILDTSDGGSLAVPEHIWAHLRALEEIDGAPQEFVLVAHNSPYANVLEMSALCTDMCAEIPWLRNSLFGQLHLVPIYGVVLCCRVDQVADKLVDFPGELQAQPRPLPTLPPSPLLRAIGSS